MDLASQLATVLLSGLALAALVLLLVRRPATVVADPALAAAVADLRVEVQRSLGATEQQVLSQTEATRRALSEVARELGVAAERSARVGELARDIGSLHDLLRSPSTAGLKPAGGRPHSPLPLPAQRPSRPSPGAVQGTQPIEA